MLTGRFTGLLNSFIRDRCVSIEIYDIYILRIGGVALDTSRKSNARKNATLLIRYHTVAKKADTRYGALYAYADD